MRKFVLLAFGFSLKMASIAQSPPAAADKVPKGGYDRDCVRRDMYTEAQRLGFFPFNVADSIKLVSFRYHDNDYPVLNDNTKGDSLHYNADSLIEQRLLDRSEINQLTDILYNYGPKKDHHIGYENECFEPRNAVLFIDKTGRLKAYMLICFHCRHFESSGNSHWPWDNCGQKSEMIHQFFIKAGIKFGTDLTIDGYPGE
jgi:hypothetical protein